MIFFLFFFIVLLWEDLYLIDLACVCVFFFLHVFAFMDD